MEALVPLPVAHQVAAETGKMVRNDSMPGRVSPWGKTTEMPSPHYANRWDTCRNTKMKPCRIDAEKNITRADAGRKLPERRLPYHIDDGNGWASLMQAVG
nr:hypothetical protein [Oryzomonas rubra]